MMDLLQGIAIIIASGTAIYGITAWRREYVGKRRIDLAEEVLVLFYEARDAIAFMRNPLGNVDEGSTRKTREYETESETRMRNRAFVLIERYDKRSEVFSRLQAKRYRFMALFGASTAKPFEDLGGVLKEIFVASHVLSDLWSTEPAATQTERKNRRAEITNYERLFWSGLSDDPIKPRVDGIIEEIDGTCRAIIDRQTALTPLTDWITSAVRRWRRSRKTKA